jgi:hypothetical protein
MIMKVNIDKFEELLKEYIDPYEIPGAMDAFINAAEDTVEDTESYEIWKEKHNDTQVSIGKDITGR